ncbi:MAG: sel1 repeat family protein, partial [SAR324 cluster bacterium]|nr:sel1 repeat family protein [SAR324 cluster bacterium]
MKQIAIPALLLFTAIAVFVGWAVWPTDLESARSAYERGRFERVLRILEPLVEAGNPEAQFQLGEMYALGRGVPEDDAEAARWFQRAAAQGHVGAQFQLGAMHARGEGVPINIAQSVEWFGRAALGGTVEAARRIQDVAGQGHPVAQFYLAEMYEQGRGVAEAPYEAAKWYYRAAVEGDGRAVVRAVGRLRQLAGAGLPEAQYRMGRMSAAGRAVVPDPAEAARWYALAAAQGNASAQFELGMALAEGRGVKKNPATAAEWVGKAAGQGNAAAQLQFGLMLAQGQGVSRNEDEAVTWFRRAIQGGNKEGIAALRPFAEAGHRAAQ